MCLAIYQPPQETVPSKYLIEAARTNKDGFGYSYISTADILVTFRTLDWEEWVWQYEHDIARNPHTPFVIHARMATHGDVNLENTHPISVNPRMTMIHNGIISVSTKNAKGRSDTRLFADKVLKQLPATWLDNPHLVDVIEDYTRGSKLVFLTTDPRLQQAAYILCERGGHWREKVWYSNYTYLPWQPYKPVIVKKEDATANVSGASNDYQCPLCYQDSDADLICHDCDACIVCLCRPNRCSCWSAPTEDRQIDVLDQIKSLAAADTRQRPGTAPSGLPRLRGRGSETSPGPGQAGNQSAGNRRVVPPLGRSEA